jgi:probable phosphoglycerate mutase
MRTAELAGLTSANPDPDLLEWDYGGYEGLTAEQIRESRPGWDLWRTASFPATHTRAVLHSEKRR